jgi:hypothetical protein
MVRPSLAWRQSCRPSACTAALWRLRPRFGSFEPVRLLLPTPVDCCLIRALAGLLPLLRRRSEHRTTDGVSGRHRCGGRPCHPDPRVQLCSCPGPGESRGACPVPRCSGRGEHGRHMQLSATATLLCIPPPSGELTLTSLTLPCRSHPSLAVHRPLVCGGGPRTAAGPGVARVGGKHLRFLPCADFLRTYDRRKLSFDSTALL